MFNWGPRSHCPRRSGRVPRRSLRLRADQQHLGQPRKRAARPCKPGGEDESGKGDAFERRPVSWPGGLGEMICGSQRGMAAVKVVACGAMLGVTVAGAKLAVAPAGRLAAASVTGVLNRSPDSSEASCTV